MWAFDSLLDAQRDIAGRVRARIQLRDDAGGAVETFTLKFPDTPTVPQRNAAVDKLVTAVNEQRYPPAKPVWDGTGFTPAVIANLKSKGVWKLVINEQHTIDL